MIFKKFSFKNIGKFIEKVVKDLEEEQFKLHEKKQEAEDKIKQLELERNDVVKDIAMNEQYTQKIKNMFK